MFQTWNSGNISMLMVSRLVTKSFIENLIKFQNSQTFQWRIHGTGTFSSVEFYAKLIGKSTSASVPNSGIRSQGFEFFKSSAWRRKSWIFNNRRLRSSWVEVDDSCRDESQPKKKHGDNRNPGNSRVATDPWRKQHHSAIYGSWPIWR